MNKVGEFIDKGNSLYGFGRYEDALVIYELAILFDQDNKDVYTGKGKTLDKLNRHKEAREAFLAASRLVRAKPLSEQKTSLMSDEPFRYER